MAAILQKFENENHQKPHRVRYQNDRNVHNKMNQVEHEYIALSFGGDKVEIKLSSYGGAIPNGKRTNK